MLKFIKKLLINQYLLFFLIIAIFSVAIFYDFFKYDYLIPPGDDCLRHMTVAYNINHSGHITLADSLGFEQALTDVPVFHILISILSQILGISVVTVTQYLVRGTIVFIAVSLYIITRRFFSKTTALLSLCFLSFFSYTMQTIFTEGTYLDLFSASLMLPWAMLWLSYYLNPKENRTKYFLLSWIFLSAVFLTHPLTSIGLMFILGFLNIIIIIYSLFKKSYPVLKRLLFLDFALIISFLGAWNFYLKNLVLKFSGLLKLIFVFKGDTASASEQLNFIPPSLGLSDVPGWHNYVEFITLFVIIFSLLGFIYLLLSKINFYKKIIIISWIAGLLFASQLSAVQLPIRFARDLYLPAILVCGLFFIWFFKELKDYKKVSLAAKILLIIFIIFQAKGSLAQAKNYNLFVRLQDPDALAVNWIVNNTNQDDLFLGTPLVANADWGSYITLLTGRQVNDCVFDRIIEPDHDVACSTIYDPNQGASLKYYVDQNIDYIYGGKMFIGPYLWKDYTNWDHYSVLEKVEWLDIVFDTRDDTGRVVIYKINKDKLLTQYEQSQDH